MRPSQAAEIIGCSPQHVRYLIRAGLLRARKRKSDSLPGYRYDVSIKEAERIRDTPQSRGYPRGRKRV